MPKKELSAKKSTRHNFRFLLNANISRKIIPQLFERFSLDLKHISDFSSTAWTDAEIVSLAKKEKRTIITHDLDYGEIYYLKEKGKIGVIMLRLQDQTSANVVGKLTNFFQNPKYQKANLSSSLTIISDEKIRIFSPKRP